jgi:O-antigen ligase
MAGMEIFGWLTFVLVITYYFRAPVNEPLRFRDFDSSLPWKSCLLLMAITIIGVFTNGISTADPVFDIGSQRWMFLLATHSFALALWPPTLKGYRVFLIFTSLVAVYAVFQSLTGIDLMRPGSNRAVQPLDLQAKFQLWRSAGFFGSPLQYGYIAGQHACLPLAVALLNFHERHKRRWLFWGSTVCFALIALSLVTTFTRGAWIAMMVAWIFMAWFGARRLAIVLAGGATVAFAGLFSTIEIFRTRVLSLFDAGYQSNTDRLLLWKANWAMFLDYPIFGTGYQENETRAKEYVTRLGHPDAFTGHAHNNYLQMLAGTGITGFLTYMFIICFMLWLTWRLWRTLPTDLWWPRAIALAALGAQIHLHIGGFTECNFKAGATNHNLMVVWALVISISVLYSRGFLKKRYEVTDSFS